MQPAVAFEPAKAGRSVRVSVPASVAGNFKQLAASMKDIATRLGHPACFTGCDIFQFQLEREFVMTRAAEINPQPLPPRLPGPGDAAPDVVVTLTSGTNNNLDSIIKATKTALGKLGCPNCCSGFDILFRRELDMLAINDNLEVQGFGRFR